MHVFFGLYHEFQIFRIAVNECQRGFQIMRKGVCRIPAALLQRGLPIVYPAHRAADQSARSQYQQQACQPNPCQHGQQFPDRMRFRKEYKF